MNVSSADRLRPLLSTCVRSLFAPCASLRLHTTLAVVAHAARKDAHRTRTVNRLMQMWSPVGPPSLRPAVLSTTLRRSHCAEAVHAPPAASAGAVDWAPHTDTSGAEPLPPREIFPLPPGIEDRFGLYELVGTEGRGPNEDGERAILGVHGPRKYWIAGGGNYETAHGGMFAVATVAGKQYKLTRGDTLYCHKIPGEVNSKIILEQINLVGTLLWSVFGRPYIPNATVVATVEAQTRTGKVIVAKFKKRKGYRRRQGHRQAITRLRIDSICYELPGADLLQPHKIPYNPLRAPERSHYRGIRQ